MDFKKDLSSYLLENCKTSIISEAIQNRDVYKAIDLMRSFLKKRNVYTVPVIEMGNIDGESYMMVFCYTNKNTGCAFIWTLKDTSTLSSIGFTNDFDGFYTHFQEGEPQKWDVLVEIKGASVVRALQLVADVMNGRITADKASLNKAIRDAQIWESVNESNDPTINALERKKFNMYQRIKDWEKKGKDTTSLQAEYEKIKLELEDARISVRNNVAVIPDKDTSIDKAEQRFEEEERALPEERFEDMESYIKNVVNGIDVSALICGAPGVGKTFRIMQIIKKKGLQRGVDYEVIKGKCTPLMLYTTLHDFQKKGQLLIIDDADDIIKDEVSINLIKAATDSSEERIVSYGTSAAPIAPEEKVEMFDDFEQDGKGIWRYPKNFVYEGGIIIITNMNAGMIDTAIRSRAMICDLNFTTAEVLDLVRGIAPNIAPEILTPACKEKALAYLQELADNGSPMEISIRSFTLVAKLYLSDAPENAIQRRIKEQMRLKFLRGGRKY